MNASWIQSWQLLAFRGVLLIVFAVAALAWPVVSLHILVAMFAAYALLAGSVWVFGAVGPRPPGRGTWFALLLGALSLAAGSAAALMPAMTLFVLVLIMGANALVTGAFDIAAAFALRKRIGREWLLAFGGAVSLLFGLLVLLYPQGAGLLALLLMLSIYAGVAGVLLLVLAVRLRAWTRLHAPRSSPAAGAR
jgi:uncharacterized membrane protein HdeD (DUF308 family)